MPQEEPQDAERLGLPEHSEPLDVEHLGRLAPVDVARLEVRLLLEEPLVGEVPQALLVRRGPLGLPVGGPQEGQRESLLLAAEPKVPGLRPQGSRKWFCGKVVAPGQGAASPERY